MTFDTVKKIAAVLPGVTEGTSYGTPALKVRQKLIARLKEDGETLVVRMGIEDRDILADAEPEVFFVTDHYREHPWILVRLKCVRKAVLADLLEQAWRQQASKKLIAEYDG